MFDKIRNRVLPLFDRSQVQSVGDAKYFSMVLGLPERAHLGTGSLKNLFAAEVLPEEQRRLEAEKSLLLLKNHPMAADPDFEMPGLKSKNRTVAASLDELYGYDEDDDSNDPRAKVLALLRGGLVGDIHYLRYYDGSPDPLIALSSALFVELVRLYADMGYISRQECWGLLYINAERTRVSFSSWEGYVDAWQRSYVMNNPYDPTNVPGKEKSNKKAEQAAAIAKKMQVDWPTDDIFSNLKRFRKVHSVPKIKGS